MLSVLNQKYQKKEHNDSKVSVDKGFLFVSYKAFYKVCMQLGASSVYEHYIKNIEGYYE